VQSLADTAWRLARIPGLEYAIFALGAEQFADLFPDHDPANRARLIEAHTFLTFEKQLRNLQIQEGRLARQQERDLAALRQLQTERRQRERAQLERAAKLYLKAQNERKPFQPADFGFEFTTAQIREFISSPYGSRLLDPQPSQRTSDLDFARLHRSRAA
jgi:hypothetical protein